jgi:hypothetical protein
MAKITLKEEVAPAKLQRVEGLQGTAYVVYRHKARRKEVILLPDMAFVRIGQNWKVFDRRAIFKTAAEAWNATKGWALGWVVKSSYQEGQIVEAAAWVCETTGDLFIKYGGDHNFHVEGSKIHKTRAGALRELAALKRKEAREMKALERDAQKNLAAISRQIKASQKGSRKKA